MSTATAPSPTVTDALSRRRRVAILLICSMSLLIVGIDITIVNVALPSIGRDFDAPLSGLQWAVDAYTLVLASLLMLSGSTADRFGRRRTFVIGLLTFAAGSLLCSVAPTLNALIVFRMVQAVGGSMLNPVAMSIITNTFTIPRERAQAIGVWAAVVGVSMALGPVVGGVLVTSVGWRSIFWINIPIGLAAVILALRYIPESKAAVPRKVDVPGQALVITLLASLTYGIIEGPGRGWSSPIIVGSFVLAAASLIAFVLWERRVARAARRPAVLPLRALLRGRGHRRRGLRRPRWLPLPQHPLPPRTCAGSPRCTPGSTHCPWRRWSCSCRRCRAASSGGGAAGSPWSSPAAGWPWPASCWWS